MWTSIVAAFETTVGQLQANVYWLTVLYLFLSEFGAPIPLPGNLVLIASGFLVGQQGDLPVLMVLLALAAVIPGAAVLYWIGRRGGQPLLDRFGPRIGLRPERRIRIAAWLDRRAVSGLIVVRLLPTIRVGTTLLPGAMGMPVARYLVGMGCALAAWVLMYVGIGYAIALFSS
jgi:membrane protein DedA with SNARE-associated domain